MNSHKKLSQEPDDSTSMLPGVRSLLFQVVHSRRVYVVLAKMGYALLQVDEDKRGQNGGNWYLTDSQATNC